MFSEIRTMNTNEKVPEYFYIFTGRNPDSLFSQIEKYNIGLRDGTIISNGFQQMFSMNNPKVFLTGDVDYLPYIKNPDYFGGVSPFNWRIVERYSIEYNLEVYRLQHYKHYPSRFSGLFAFGDYETCKNISNKYPKIWKLEDCMKYKLKDCGVYNEYIKVVKTNYNIIGLLDHLGYGESIFGNEAVYDAYWKGQENLKRAAYSEKGIVLPERKVGARYEYIIEGILECCGKAVD